jgi:hypothetical protein
LIFEEAADKRGRIVLMQKKSVPVRCKKTLHLIVIAFHAVRIPCNAFGSAGADGIDTAGVASTDDVPLL